MCHIVSLLQFQFVNTKMNWILEDCWAVKNHHENEISVGRYRCCIGCVVRLDMIELEMTTLERVGVTPIVEKMM